MRGSILLVLAGVLVAETVLACPACGDKLNFGGGMDFERMNRSQMAGHVVLLTPPEIEHGTANAGAEISSVLEKNGHHVELAGDDTSLQQLLIDHPIDVVIVHWAQAANTAQLLLGGPVTAPTLLPVAFDDKDAAAAITAGTTACLARVDQRRGKKLAEAVARIVEERRKGISSTCAVTVGRRTE